MGKQHKILADHQKRGKILVPPFIHRLGPIQEVSWVNTIIPEILWIGLIQHEHGIQRGAELITSMARTTRNVNSSGTRQIFAAASSYSSLSGPEWEQLRQLLAASGDLLLIQKPLEPLIELFPKCPLRGAFSDQPTSHYRIALSKMRRLISSLYQREDREAMMVQATAIWLAFDADVLKVFKGLSLARFPEIENYPDTEISRKIGGSIRVAINVLFGSALFNAPDIEWPQYFWNRGLAITSCEFTNE